MLEVGAGTGVVARHLGGLLDPADSLDICEPDPKFTEILERDVLTREPLAAAVARGRVRLLRQPVQMLSERRRYDYVIAGLPFTAFALSDLRDVFAVIRGALKPGGVLSYFEYVGLRKTSRVLSIGRNRTRVRSVSAFLAQNIRDFQFDRKTVLRNLPPAFVRHLRFDPAPAAQGRPNLGSCQGSNRGADPVQAGPAKVRVRPATAETVDSVPSDQGNERPKDQTEAKRAGSLTEVLE